MALLFQVEGKLVVPNAETLLISPFKEIWSRDKSKDKLVATQEFAYMEFMTSMLKSNPYREYPDEKKDSILRREVMLNEKWKPDKLITEGIKKIISFQVEGSITYSYWISNKVAIEKMINFFNNFDIDERNFKSGMPIYKPKDITSAITDAEKTLSTLNALKTKVDEEVYEISKTRSDKRVSPFANPNSLNLQ